MNVRCVNCHFDFTKMYEKHKRKLIMEQRNAEDEMYQRHKKCWLSYGWAMLTIGILGLLTVAIFAMTQSNSGDATEHNSRVIVDEVFHRSGSHGDEVLRSINDDEAAINRKIVKRNVDLVPKSDDESAQNLNDVNSENNPIMDEQHMKLLKRQQQGSNKNHIQHRHSDGDVYYFKGYKCVPIRKPFHAPISLRQHPGMLGCFLIVVLIVH